MFHIASYERISFSTDDIVFRIELGVVSALGKKGLMKESYVEKSNEYIEPLVRHHARSLIAGPTNYILFPTEYEKVTTLTRGSNDEMVPKTNHRHYNVLAKTSRFIAFTTFITNFIDERFRLISCQKVNFTSSSPRVFIKILQRRGVTENYRKQIFPQAMRITNLRIEAKLEPLRIIPGRIERKNTIHRNRK